MPETTPIRRSFRLVCRPEHVAHVEALLKAQGFACEPEPFFPLARRLVAEPFPLGASLAAAWGLVYIQDRSSMLPPLALAPKKGARVLDCCASPGSKTSLLAQLVEQDGLVLGNEPSRPRLITLQRNLATMNIMQAVTCQWRGERLPLPPASWEHILLDPPCSGWGTTAKHLQAIKMWRGDKVKPLIRLQRDLLTQAACLLKPGGRMVYSTCTTNVEENEAQVHFAVNELGLELQPLQPFPGFVFADPLLPGCEGTLRVDESASAAQGFYIACFTKSDAAVAVSHDTQNQPLLYNSVNKILKQRQLIPREYLHTAGFDPSLLPEGELAVFNGAVHFLPQQALSILPPHLRWQGMALGKASSGRIFFSTHLRGLINPTAHSVPRLQLDETGPIEALMQGQSLQTALPGRAASLFWRDLPLGQVRLKNGRALL